MPLDTRNTGLFYTLSGIDCTTNSYPSKSQLRRDRPKISGDDLADAIDILANYSSGARRRTRKQEREDREQKARGIEPLFPVVRPTPAEARAAQRMLGRDICAFLVAHRWAKGAFPARQSDESRADFWTRVEAECRACDARMWKAALLNSADCPVPERIALAIAQDSEWHVGPGHVRDAAIVPGELRVHVEARCQKNPDSAPQWYLLYPKCIYRGDDHVEIGRDGKLRLSTVEYSRWRICLGWPDMRARLQTPVLTPFKTDTDALRSEGSMLSPATDREQEVGSNKASPT